MSTFISYTKGRDLMLEQTKALPKESVSLDDLYGRVLAEDVFAKLNVPAFDRSPYDGYAFCSADTLQADKEHPVTLQILEEIPAGSVSHYPVTKGTAVKVLTGAPIPKGADAVIKYELTEFTDTTVTLFTPVKAGSNIVRIGEDVKAGDCLAKAGTRVDAGMIGTLASQNISSVYAHRIPKIGILSTGTELLEVGSESIPGKIYDANRHMLQGAVQNLGCIPIMYGPAVDNAAAICDMLKKALTECDAVLITGGVSVGDYDLTPLAMEMAGAEVFFRGVAMKPGMACAYGMYEQKPICALSGNPAAAITNFYAIAAAVLRKRSGLSYCIPQEITVTLCEGFRKKSPTERFLRGTLDLSDGTVRMHISAEQGNVVLSSTIGCDVIAIIPAGSDPIPAGTTLKGFII